MRALKRALLSFVIAVLAVLVLTAPAFADNYTYTVRIFPGNNGSLTGASEDGVLVLGPYEYGELVRSITPVVTARAARMPLRRQASTSPRIATMWLPTACVATW